MRSENIQTIAEYNGPKVSQGGSSTDRKEATEEGGHFRVTRGKNGEEKAPALVSRLGLLQMAPGDQGPGGISVG